MPSLLSPFSIIHGNSKWLTKSIRWIYINKKKLLCWSEFQITMLMASQYPCILECWNLRSDFDLEHRGLRVRSSINAIFSNAKINKLSYFRRDIFDTFMILMGIFAIEWAASCSSHSWTIVDYYLMLLLQYDMIWLCYVFSVYTTSHHLSLQSAKFMAFLCTTSYTFVGRIDVKLQSAMLQVNMQYACIESSLPNRTSNTPANALNIQIDRLEIVLEVYVFCDEIKNEKSNEWIGGSSTSNPCLDRKNCSRSSIDYTTRFLKIIYRVRYVFSPIREGVFGLRMEGRVALRLPEKGKAWKNGNAMK